MNITLRLVASLAVVTACSAQTRIPKGLDAAIRDLGSLELSTRIEAFYDLVLPFSGDSGDLSDGILALLVKYPDQASHIKTVLIAALEGEAAYRRRMQQQGEYLSEAFGGYYGDLIYVVGTFKDQRAVLGLLSGLDTGGIAGNALGDLCPQSIDKLVRAAHEPEHYFRGQTMYWRSGAIAAIGVCFERPAAMLQDPEATSKARTALLSALGDPDPNVRAAAARSLVPLRRDPVVRAQLEYLVANDTFTRRAFPNEKLRAAMPKQQGMRFGVREVAAYVLAIADDKPSFYVTMLPDSHQCIVTTINDQPAGERLIGPFDSEAQALRSMCRHLDLTGKDSLQCWAVSPVGVCRN
jgi:HEAT repeat protein